MRIVSRLFQVISLAAVFSLMVVQPAASRPDLLPDSAYIEGLVGHAQTYNLSCESRSAADWAGYWGVRISEAEFLYRLPRSDNPEAGFVGDPNGYWGAVPPYSYGVHAKPVAKLLRDYGLEAKARQDMSWKDLRKEIAADRPVIVWVIGAVWPGSATRYEAQDGSTVAVAAFEHTMIMVGYDEWNVYLVDAANGWAGAYPVSAFQKSWGVLGNMAVVWVDPKQSKKTPPTPTVVPTETIEPTPAPTRTPAAVSFVNVGKPTRIFAPLVVHLGPGEYKTPSLDVVPAGVCLSTYKGVFQARSFSTMQGWCLSAPLVRPAYFTGISGGIPELSPRVLGSLFGFTSGSPAHDAPNDQSGQQPNQQQNGQGK